MLKDLVSLWRDQRGITTAEVIGYTLLFAGITALVGYGLSGGLRGLAGSVIRVIKDADPNNP